MGSRARALACLALTVPLALSGAACRKRAVTFINPQADFSLIHRVAVLPMENLTQDPTAGEKVRQLLIIQLLASEAVEVVDVGEVARGIRASGVANAVSPGTEEIKKLGTELGVQALMAGSVQEFAQVKSGGAPSTSVSMVFRMIETDTGQVIWSSNVSQSGAGAMARLFGVGGDSTSDRARKLIHKALRSLVR